jgi:Tfp pilus assembly protein PilN
MTAQLNLLPVSYRQQRRRVQRMKRALAAGLCIVCIEFVVGVVLMSYSGEVVETRKRISGLNEDYQLLNTKLARLTAEQRSLKHQHTLVNELGMKHTWSDVLRSIAMALPDTARLTQLESIPATGAISVANADQAGRRTSTSADEEERLELAEGLLMTGTATDHETIAAFLRNLNTKADIGQCILESTNRARLKSAEGVSFVIRSRW